MSGWLLVSLTGLALLFAVLFIPAIKAIHHHMHEEAEEDKEHGSIQSR